VKIFIDTADQFKLYKEIQVKIFIDTAKLDEIKEACSWGIIDGVTTNPTLIKLAVETEKGKGKNVNMEDYIKEILKAVGKGGAVSLEVISRF